MSLSLYCNYCLYSDCLLDFLLLMLVLFLFIAHFQNQNPKTSVYTNFAFKHLSLITFTTLLKPKFFDFILKYFRITGDILNLHQSIWLSKKYIKLNWSGDSIYSQNFRGATQAHVREISFGEVMRWSLLPTDTELHHMYERQRIVFGIFCSNRK